MKSSPLALLGPVHVAEGAQAEAIAAARVDVAVDGYGRTAAAHLERFADLGVELEVGDRAPVLGSRLARQQTAAHAARHLAPVIAPCNRNETDVIGARRQSTCETYLTFKPSEAYFSIRYIRKKMSTPPITKAD